MPDIATTRAAARRSPAKPQSRKRSAQGPQRWLAKARLIGDPPADVLVRSLARKGRLAEVNERIAAGTLGPSSALPRSVTQFLAGASLPAWASRSRILRAQRFGERHSVAIASALFGAALPMAFTGAKGVSVLRATGRMHDDVDRRVNETGRFVFQVLMPGGFESHEAVSTIQNVRLLHAAVRHRILSTARADRGREVPINQEDLLGTWVCFSVVVLDALKKLGVRVTSAEAEDFLHLWRVVGSLLGIREAWLPKSVSAARTLGETIRERQGRATADGRALAAVLVDGIERHLPARGFRVLAPGAVRFLLGDELAQMLGIREGVRVSDLARLAPVAADWLARVDQRMFGGALPKVGRALLELGMTWKLGGRAPSFQAPLTPALGCPIRREERAR